MPKPVVYGLRSSVYVQALRLTLWAKTISYDLVEVDVWSQGQSPEHLGRHPFGKIPAFQHGDLRLYETSPTCRYVDEAFPGPALQPPTPIGRAVMGQAISIMDNYAYRSLVWGLYVEMIEGPRLGRAPDETRMQSARRLAATCLHALDSLAPDQPWLSGDMLTLADLHAAPMFNLFMMTADAAELMRPHARLQAWWERVSDHVAAAGVLQPA
jgi:glutathione S-transferase